MPAVSFQKLSNCTVAGAPTLAPPTIYPHVTHRYFNSIRLTTQGVYASGTRSTLEYLNWIYQGQYLFSGLLYSSSDNVNFTLRASGSYPITKGYINLNDIGLTTGTSYYYYVLSRRELGGVIYENRGPTLEIKTREPVQATGGNYTMKWWNKHGQWKMHVYRDSANFVTTNVPRGEKVWCFLLGGGGSGGKSRGGGGGGGGVSFFPIFNWSGNYLPYSNGTDNLFNADFNYLESISEISNWGGINISSNTTYPITIGAGGGEVNGGGAAQGNDGGNSTAFGFTGRGGGGGGAYANNARSGGCGGGGGSFSSAYYTGGLSVSGHLISGYYFGFVNRDWNSYTNIGSYVSQFSDQGIPGAAGTGNYGGGGGGLAGNSSYTFTSIDGKAGFYPVTYQNYFFVGTGLSGTATRFGAGGGGGGYSSGNGGANLDNGAGDGSQAWGQDYYAYPAGLGGAASWFGCGGGGGGKGGGGGGAGYKGLVIVAYATGDPKDTVNGW